MTDLAAITPEQRSDHLFGLRPSEHQSGMERREEFFAQLRDADRKAGALDKLRYERNLIADLYLEDESPEHDDTGRRVVLMILADLDAHIAELEKENG